MGSTASMMQEKSLASVHEAYNRAKDLPDAELLHTIQTVVNKLIASTPDVKVAPTYEVGDRVEGNYLVSGHWYKGDITSEGKDINGLPVNDIIYDDEETEEAIAEVNVRKIEKKPLAERMARYNSHEPAPAHAPVVVPAEELVVDGAQCVTTSEPASAPAAVVENQTERLARNLEFQISCGKYAKGGKADLNKAIQLLSSGNVDIDAVDNDEWSALFHAAGEGHRKIVSFLLENNATIDLKDSCGCTPLWVAAFNNQRDSVKALLLAGANEKIKGQPEGEPSQTPALAARRNRHPGLADYIDGESMLREQDSSRIEIQKRREMTMEEFQTSLRTIMDKNPADAT